MVIGQGIFIEGAGNFVVVSKAGPLSVTLQYHNDSHNTHSFETISAGAGVSPGGLSGVDATTVTTTSTFDVPIIGVDVSITVQNSSWMVIGQIIFVEGAGAFQVVSKADTSEVTATYLDYNGNTHAGDTIAVGAAVSPSGTQPSTPISIANGGTGATTVAGAQVALGLGQPATEFNDGALTFDIPGAAFALITGVTVAVPASGLYLVLARVTVRYTGVTFAASRVLTIRVQDTTDATTISTATRATSAQTPSTHEFPSFDYVLPFVTASLTTGHTLETQIMLDTVESAGSSQVTAASLCIVPIVLS